jgi:hypothetical protein
MSNPVIVDINYTKRPQRGGLLCWAASTQIVADTLGVTTDVLGLTIDQANIATHAWVKETGSAAIVAAFKAKLAKCDQNIEQFCNRTWHPILDELGITCLLGSALALNPPCLTPAQIQFDIDHNRPIIFGWQYGPTSDSGVHFMVIVGYRITSAGVFQLDIFDPLPVNVGNPPVNVSNPQTISYDNYTVTTPINLHNDMGVPYKLLETYYFAHLASQAVPAAPTGLTVDGQLAMAGTPPARAMIATPLMDPRAAVPGSAPAAMEELARRTAAGGQSLILEVPLAIVAAGLDDLRSTDPAALIALLQRGTSAVLYPVSCGGSVRDSFLILRVADQWIQGGYANTTVARLLVEERQRRASTPAQLAEHYLFSVPALGAFFLAHGSGAGAIVIPMTDDRSIEVGGRGLQANTPYRADQVLPALSAAAMRFGPSHGDDERRPR